MYWRLVKHICSLAFGANLSRASGAPRMFFIKLSSVSVTVTIIELLSTASKSHSNNSQLTPRLKWSKVFPKCHPSSKKRREKRALIEMPIISGYKFRVQSFQSKCKAFGMKIYQSRKLRIQLSAFPKLFLSILLY